MVDGRTCREKKRYLGETGLFEEYSDWDDKSFALGSIRTHIPSFYFNILCNNKNKRIFFCHASLGRECIDHTQDVIGDVYSMKDI